MQPNSSTGRSIAPPQLEGLMDKQERFEALADKGGYASSNGLVITPIYRRASDGKLVHLGIANIPEPGEPDGPEKRSVSFDLQSGGGRYREERRISEGVTGVTYQLPFNFSESYQIADIWKGTRVGESRSWEEFSEPERFIDFLASRLVPPSD